MSYLDNPEHKSELKYYGGIVEPGRVTTVDTTMCQLTVTFLARNYQSGALSYLKSSCFGAQEYDNPTEGDTVLCLHDGLTRERGYVLGCLYTKGNPPPFGQSAGLGNGTWRGIMFSDNSYIVYDQSGSNYILNLQGKVTLTTVGDVLATIGGKLTAAVTGAIDIEGQSTGKFNAVGGLTLNGVTIDSAGNLTCPGTIDTVTLNTSGNSFAGTRTGGPI